MIITNAFSLNMLDANGTVHVEVTRLSRIEEVLIILLESGYTSAIGHADTAVVFASVLGVAVPFNRATVTLNRGDEAIVGQYRGPRLPEGATSLPEGASIEWLHVSVS